MFRPIAHGKSAAIAYSLTKANSASDARHNRRTTGRNTGTLHYIGAKSRLGALLY